MFAQGGTVALAPRINDGGCCTGAAGAGRPLGATTDEPLSGAGIGAGGEATRAHFPLAVREDARVVSGDMEVLGVSKASESPRTRSASVAPSLSVDPLR